MIIYISYISVCHFVCVMLETQGLWNTANIITVKQKLYIQLSQCVLMI